MAGRTRITRLVMHGFKSFAKRTELEFDDEFNVVIGPNGSGKCLTGDALVSLANGRTVPIRELVEAHESTAAKIDDGWVAPGDGTRILSVDPETMRLEARPIDAFVKRTAPDSLLKIRTSSGRELTATPYHPLFAYRKGRMSAMRADELAEGTRIAVPRALPQPENSNVFVELLDRFTVEDKLYTQTTPELRRRIHEHKGSSWKTFSQEHSVPLQAIKGLLDGQSVNVAYLIRLLRGIGMSDARIIDHVSHISTMRSRVRLRVPWRNSPEFSRVLGYLLAEGHVTGNGQIWFTNGDENIVEDYAQLVRDVFGLRVTVNEYKANAWDVLCYSTALIRLLAKFGMGTSAGDKRVSDLYLAHTDETCSTHLLAALYDGDGYVAAGHVDLTTKSVQLARDIETLLLRLDIVPRRKRVVKYAGSFSGSYELITVYGSVGYRNFGRLIPLRHPRKRERLDAAVEKTSNPNLDLIEGNELIRKAVAESGVSVKRLKRHYPRLDAYVYDRCLPSRDGIALLLEKVFTQHTQTTEQLQRAAGSDLLWDEVVSVEQIEPPEPYVYDLCVSDHHNFIANNVVAHNSNVMDALCFVLGKSGAKGLRAEKSANLIYNGGKAKTPAKRAEVSIFFDNSSGVFPIPDKELKVSRILTPKGTSTYKINDKTHTRQQVVDMLAAARINPDGYNIILQGDIVRFVEMSGKERREVIEQIAGIDVYEEKRQKTENELDKTAGKLKEADILIAERKAHLDELKVDRDQALKYRELESNVQSYRATLLHRKNADLLEKKQNLDEQKEKIEKQIATYDEAITKRKQDVDAARKRIDEISAEIERKGEKEQLELQREIEDLKVDLARKESRVSVLESELNNITSRRGQLKEELKEIDERAEKLGTAQKALEKERTSKQQEVERVEDMIDKFKAKHKIEDDDGLQEQIDELDTKGDELQTEMLEMREKNQGLLRDKDKAEYELEAIERQKEKVKEIESEHRKEIEAIKERKKLFKDTVRKIEQLLTEDGRLAQDNARLRSETSRIADEKAKIEGQLTAMRAKSTASKAVDTIIANKKRFKGVRGTVFELLSVTRTNALALETAAGGRLNAIVVEDDGVAKECIQFLRSQKIGTATFLPMNKIRAPKDRESAGKHKGKDGVIGFARQLAKYDSEYGDVMRYVFGDTLVVRDLDTARSLGIGSARFVTRDGDIVEASGAMQGGFRKQNKGALSMGQMVEQLDELEKEHADAMAQLSKVANRRESLETELNELKTSKAELEGEIIKGEKSLHLAGSDLDADDDKARSLKTEIESLDTEIKKLQSEVTKKTRELTNIKVERQKLKSRIAEQKNPRVLAELQAFQQKHQQLRERIIAIDAQLSSAQGREGEMHASEKRKIEGILKQLEGDEKKFVKELEETKQALEKGRAALEEKEAAAKEFYDAFKELFRERNEKSDELRAHESELDSTEQSKREEERKLNNLSLKIAEQQASIAAIGEEMGEYAKAKIIPEDEASTAELQSKISSFEKLIADLGNVNLKALDVYDEVEKHYHELLEKKEKLEGEMESIRKLIAEIEQKKKELFMKTFGVLNGQFQDFFSQLSAKGSAFLEIENEESPFEGGVFIKVNLSGKKYMDIRSLSGGEKTMTALAFISAIQEHDPAPFYLLDEVDAALDKKNSEKLGDMVLRYSKRAQYVVISHNDMVISKANTIYGVSMNEHGSSNVVSLKV